LQSKLVNPEQGIDTEFVLKFFCYRVQFATRDHVTRNGSGN